MNRIPVREHRLRRLPKTWQLSDTLNPDLPGLAGITPAVFDDPLLPAGQKLLSGWPVTTAQSTFLLL
jgi:hypothetical protein